FRTGLATNALTTAPSIEMKYNAFPIITDWPVRLTSQGLPMITAAPENATTTPIMVLKLILSLRNSTDKTHRSSGPSKLITPAFMLGAYSRPMLRVNAVRTTHRKELITILHKYLRFSGFQVRTARGSSISEAAINLKTIKTAKGMLAIPILIMGTFNPHITYAKISATMGKVVFCLDIFVS
ncbi:MAG TPA: hypothetical protein VFK11_02155, partial [Candidatus Saccharimonadales bacterium]|nr:hypothetical protein [Candidatus Saccharimonadales bacterium]